MSQNRSGMVSYFRRMADGLAALASLLLIAGFVYFWFVPSLTECFGTSCHRMSLATSMGGATLVVSPLLALATLLFAGLLFWYRRHRLLLGGFALAYAIWFVLSFGLARALFPAAALSLIVALLPPYGRPGR